jgi:hypothetical protein
MQPCFIVAVAQPTPRLLFVRLRLPLLLNYRCGDRLATHRAHFRRRGLLFPAR